MKVNGLTKPNYSPHKTTQQNFGMLNNALRKRLLYRKKLNNFTGKELDAETGLYYYGARYLDPKTGRWLSGDPAMGEYLPVAPVNDDARKRNQNLPGQGGVFNYVNLHAYHYAGNNPVKLVDPDGIASSFPDGSPEQDAQWDKAMNNRRSVEMNNRIRRTINENHSFTSTSMACDLFVTKVLSDAGVKPEDWLNPLDASVKDYRALYKKDLKTTASPGWNIVIMISDHPTINLNGREISTDRTPHMGLMYKDEKTGKLTLYHFTKGEVRIQEFENEADFIERMPREVYRYDTAEYKRIE